MENNEDAEQSVKVEWDKLEGRNSWDLSKAMSLKVLIQRAKEQDFDLHIGALHELCVEKGSELPDRQPNGT